MGIGRLFRQIYVMDMPVVVILALLGTIAYYLIDQKLENRRLWLVLRGCMLAVILGAVLYITLGERDSSSYGLQMVPFHSYREVAAGGNRELYRSNFMNVLLFYPAGLFAVTLLPGKWPKWGRLVITVFCFTVISGIIEYVQYRFAMGHCEIDDVIHNALGAFLGGTAGLWTGKLLLWLKQKWENWQMARPTGEKD